MEFIMEKIMPIFICILMAFLILLMPLIIVNGYKELNKNKCIKEDVNCDGEVTIKDLLIVQKYILEKGE